MMGSFMSKGNQYKQLVKVLYCKLLTNGKQLPAFSLEVGSAFKLQSQRWEVRVLQLLQLYHCDPWEEGKLCYHNLQDCIRHHNRDQGKETGKLT